MNNESKPPKTYPGNPEENPMPNPTARRESVGNHFDVWHRRLGPYGWTNNDAVFSDKQSK